MTRLQLASSVLLVAVSAARGDAQPAPGPAPAAEPAPPPGTATEPAPAATEPAPPATGQPPPPAPPAEPAKPAAAPSPPPATAKWALTLYGFAEFDMMRDSTQSFSDSPGNGLVVRADTARLAYNNGRTQTTARNSRLGVRLTAPEYHGMRASGNIELDFMGNQPNPVSEASFVNNGTFRIRAATVKLETAYVDVLAGQSYFLFGHGSFFFPMSIWFFGLPNQAFGRTQQLRLSRTFKSEAANVEVAVAAQRPPQRDADLPDFQGGLKIGVNGWKGLHTMGSGYPAFDPLTIGVSGSVRKFRVNEFAAAPTTTRSATGWGLSLDAMLPIVPVPSAKNKANALTVTGSFTTGSGASDLIGGLNGGAAFPTLPPATPGGQPIAFTAANIDPGIVQYDAAGNLRTLNWQTFMAGIQYYLPPNGEVTVGANYTQGDSDNITTGLTSAGGVMKKSQFFELVALGDITPAVRAGVAWQRLWQTRGDDRKTVNSRVELSVYFFF